jgi:ABC-type transporter Mla MlaB component
MRCLVNRNNAPGGRAVIAFAYMGGTHSETPFSCNLHKQQHEIAILVGGDLRNIQVIRDFWNVALEVLATVPHTIWLNLAAVLEADTKLAACIVAVLRRAQEHGTQMYIVGSEAVQDMLKLCKVPPLKQFTTTS